MERETVWFRHQTVLFYIANKSATLSLLVRCNARRLPLRIAPYITWWFLFW
jgi:hypothetical protein